MPSALTAARLRQIVKYNSKTGQFTWRKRVSCNRQPGDPAGCVNSAGYIVITIGRRGYPAHRLAWLYMTGRWPRQGMMIDHRDRVRDNNRWRNLREKTATQNMQNKSLHRNSTSGVAGVTKWRNTWRANIGIAGKQKSLGSYATKREAVAARRAAEKIFYPETATARKITEHEHAQQNRRWEQRQAIDSVSRQSRLGR